MTATKSSLCFRIFFYDRFIQLFYVTFFIQTLNNLSTRYSLLFKQIEIILCSYRIILQSMAAENKEQYRSVSGNLQQKSHDLAQITEQLDRVKHEMEERGSSMTDGSKSIYLDIKSTL